MAESPESSPVGGPPAPGAFDRLPLWTVPAILVGLFVVAAGSAAVSPTFYDQVVWRYYWGPIQADGCSAYSAGVAVCENLTAGAGLEGLERHGVVAHAGYNVVNTASWAVLLGLCILFVAQLLRRFRTPMDARLIMGATSWVVAGSIFHVLEDTGLLRPPVQYVFITPPIYLLFALFGVASMALGQYLKVVAQQVGNERALQKLWMLLCIPVFGYFVLWLRGWTGLSAYVHPGLVALFVAIAFFLVRWRTRRLGRIDPTGIVLDMSVAWLLLGLAYVIMYLRTPWCPSLAGCYHGNSMPSAFVLAPSLALAGVLLVRFLPPRVVAGIALALATVFVPFATFWLAGRAWERLLGTTFPLDTISPPFLGAAYLVAGLLVLFGGVRWWRSSLANQWPAIGVALRQSVNLLIVFAQLLDGFATALGIDLHGYEEKHVLSGGIIGRFHDVAQQAGFSFGAHYKTFLGFIPVKLLVSLALIYIMDVAPQSASANPQDKPPSQTMVGLVKFAVIMVGLGPGIRDFLRLSLGV